ncbi:hypothetical protein PRZ48_008411 [Zasmidium cellare]|uniref:AB hydrolase-1 domain-containing protein n=1 Tax=Zasmidium cellare TaxID=395010 RepID=A0ABR0EFD0_ZASCE|nr:hypothetical protein PRZ48_008411 [Zasmidium cellare]
MSNPKPTFVLIPGAWHPAEIYSATETLLQAHGYPTRALQLPSVGAVPAHEDWSEDVRVIRKCLRALIEEEGKEVVVVAHSVNGLTGSEAVQGLGAQEREKGGVLRMVYLMALAMPNSLATVTPTDARHVFYNDLPDPEAQHWTSLLRHQSEGVYTTPVTHAAWRHIPSTYLIGTEDKSSITRELVDYMIGQEAPNAIDTVETCEGGGHCFMIGRAEWLAGALRRAAGE